MKKRFLALFSLSGKREVSIIKILLAWLRSQRQLYAHLPSLRNQRLPETLFDHTVLVQEYFHLFLSTGLQTSLDQLLDGITFSKEKRNREIQYHVPRSMHNLIKYMMEGAVVFHDFGKVNPLFQSQKMNNLGFHSLAERLSRDFGSQHSIYSSMMYIEFFASRIEKEAITREDKQILYRFLFDFAYLISKHHGSLSQMPSTEISIESDGFLDRLMTPLETPVTFSLLLGAYPRKRQVITYFSGLKEMTFRTAMKWSPKANIHYFLFMKLVYGLLVSSDFYATHTYSRLRVGERIPLFSLSAKKKEMLLQTYQQSDLFQAIQSNRDVHLTAESSMNQVRTRLYWDVHERYFANQKASIFLLEAPTGSGKTNVSYSLALHMLQQPQARQLIYVFPFNTLVEQTVEVIKSFLPEHDRIRLQVLNSVTSAFGGDEEDINYEHYEEELFRQQMLQYPLTITSHVNFFKMLFGVSREDNIKLPHLMGAVIVLDEIQSYHPKLWKWMMVFFERYAAIFNWKLVIMSATLPPLHNLNEETKKTTVELVEDAPSFFTHPVFQKRVEMKTEFLTAQPLKESEWMAKLAHLLRRHQGQRLLIEMITKKSAQRVYDFVRTHWAGEVWKLDGDDTKEYRERLLHRLKETTDGVLRQNIVVVTTQVIEAGVDIDMEVGIKNISLVESEEQFAGRINRSNRMKEPGLVYFLYIDKPEKVYRNEHRLAGSLHHNRELAITALTSKRFTFYYERLFLLLNHDMQHERPMQEALYYMAYLQVKQLMSIIDTETVQVFIAYHSVNYNGNEVWEEYKETIIEEMEYAEKRMKLEMLKEKMSPFLFTINQQEFEMTYDEQKFETFGEIYYVRDGERYMVFEHLLEAKRFNKQLFQHELSRVAP